MFLLRVQRACVRSVCVQGAGEGGAERKLPHGRQHHRQDWHEDEGAHEDTVYVAKILNVVAYMKSCFFSTNNDYLS